MFCNFVFPSPDINRPLPNESGDLSQTILKDDADEDLLDAISDTQIIEDEAATQETMGEREKMNNYEKRGRTALEELNKQRSKYLIPSSLEIYSPKFLEIL